MALTITRNQTPTFFAMLIASDDTSFDVSDFKSGRYTIYKSSQYMLSNVPSNALTPVPGFANVAIPSNAIIASSTVSAQNLNYNFKFSPDATEVFPFADVGIYFVEFQIVPQTGNPIVWQRTIEVV